MPTDTMHRQNAVRLDLQGKTIQHFDDHAPDLRIVFTDGSALKIEAVACGDLRYTYEARSHTEVGRVQRQR